MGSLQFVQHWSGILRAEHDAFHHILSKGYAADLFGIQWIASADKPGFHAAEEPIGVVG